MIRVCIDWESACDLEKYAFEECVGFLSSLSSTHIVPSRTLPLPQELPAGGYIVLCGSSANETFGRLAQANFMPPLQPYELAVIPCGNLCCRLYVAGVTERAGGRR